MPLKQEFLEIPFQKFVSLFILKKQCASKLRSWHFVLCLLILFIGGLAEGAACVYITVMESWFSGWCVLCVVFFVFFFSVSRSSYLPL